MPFTQTNRPLAITTPLGADALLLQSLSGHEGLSTLFNFHLGVVSQTRTKVPFESLLGKSLTVRMDQARGQRRFINGICNRVAQGASDNVFTSYHLDIVPKFWFLGRAARSRIFQHETVPQILKKVLASLNVAFEIQGKYEQRDYCVQYRETDYNFACRLMEEEGIYYFHKHTDGAHQLVLADTPGSHPPLPGGAVVTFQINTDGADDNPGRIYSWTKRQEVRSSTYTLRDHTFELAHNPLEATKKIQPTVIAGLVTHQLTAGGNGEMELYDWPGEYAQRFDGIDRGGGEQPAELQKVFQDKDRTVGVRMQQEATPAVLIQAEGDVMRLTAGHQFTLATLPGDSAAKLQQAEGSYTLLTVTHTANQGDFRSNQSEFSYDNSFTAIPVGVPYRPPRDTPKPFVQGVQTAVVVGPAGQEIFTDKFGRVKVQFHWDREGKNNADSSCWVRVAQIWAGNRWGASFWPRIGQEVIVAFQEGDPDQPIIVGSVYNSGQMPPYLGEGPDGKHKNDNKLCGVKSNTTLGGVGYNEWRFDDTKGKEQIFIHGQRDEDVRIQNDCKEAIMHDRHLIVGVEKDGKKSGKQFEEVKVDKHLKVHKDQVEHIGGNITQHVGGVDGGKGNIDILNDGKKTETIGDEHHVHVKKHFMHKVDEDYELTAKNRFTMTEADDQLHVKGQYAAKMDASLSLTIGDNKLEKIGKNYLSEAGQQVHFKAGQNVVIEAGTQLTLKVGGNFIVIDSSGVSIVGAPLVNINSGGMPGSGTAPSPAKPVDADPPDDAAEAKPDKPAQADDAVTGVKSAL